MQQDSSQSKTELPTRKRLKDLRKKGDVAKSADVSGTAAVIAGMALLALGGAHLIDRLNRLLETAVSADLRQLQDASSLLHWTRAQYYELAWITVPVTLVLVVVSALTSFAQVGPVFSLEPVQPKLSRVNPISGCKRLFSMRTFVDLLKLIVKAALLGLVIWLATRDALPTLLRSHWLPTAGLLPLTSELLTVLCWCAVACFVAIAAFDLWFQNWDYRRRNRMSVEEVRREYKETEGDPVIRGRRRQLHREVGEAAMLDDVRKASVIVVNPTHVAVALYYQPGETDLPVVVATGEGHLAGAIRRVAEEEGIPILRDVGLARRLRAAVPLNQYIPEELIEPVAAVLRWAQDVQRLAVGG